MEIKTQTSSKSLKKSIYIVGPHSTGKSTLTNALLNYYGKNTPVLYEIARNILKEKGYTAQTISTIQCYEMQKDIFEAQFQAEKNLIDKNYFFISDRNAIDPIMYTKMYSINPNDWIYHCETEYWNILVERYRNEQKSIIILLEPNKSFLKNDGTRRMPTDWNEWVKFGNLYSEFLKQQNIPYYILGENCANIMDRIDKVVSWVEM